MPAVIEPMVRAGRGQWRRARKLAHKTGTSVAIVSKRGRMIGQVLPDRRQWLAESMHPPRHRCDLQIWRLHKPWRLLVRVGRRG